MSVKSIVRGVTVGATVGAVLFVISKSSPKQKRVLRKDTERALRAVGSIMDDFTGMVN